MKQCQDKSWELKDMNSLLYHHPSPSNPKEPEQEPQWTEEKSDVVHLTDATFDDFVQQNPSVLVMFYAPCKNLKPDQDPLVYAISASFIVS